MKPIFLKPLQARVNILQRKQRRPDHSRTRNRDVQRTAANLQTGSLPHPDVIAVADTENQDPPANVGGPRSDPLQPLPDQAQQQRQRHRPRLAPARILRGQAARQQPGRVVS